MAGKSTARRGHGVVPHSAPPSGNLIRSTGFIAAMTYFLLRIIKLSFYLKLSPSEGEEKKKLNAQLSRARSKGCWHAVIGGNSVRHGGITVTGNKQPQTGSFGLMGEPRYFFLYPKAL